jgi:hypothetical protein
MQTKRYHLGDILSITTGRLVSPRHMDGVYDILNFMTGDDLYTHQLPRAADECRPYLAKQFPQLSKIDLSKVGEGFKQSWESWLADQVKEHGEYHDVRTMPMDDHDQIDPITELKQMRPDIEIIQIELPSEEDEPSDIGDINWKSQE